MVGFTAADSRYEPRAGWRLTLAQWAEQHPGAPATWQHQIGIYWRWRTLDGLSLRQAWRDLSMEPAIARTALEPSPDSGLVPPELISRLVGRSRATSINPESTAAVSIARTPETELPDADKVEDGFTPPRVELSRPALYQPRAGWKGKLGPPLNSTGWLANLHIYWRRRTEGRMNVQDAWADLNFSPNNADSALERNSENRGAIPPELIGRVVIRSGMPNITLADIAAIVIYPERNI
jgi:hypothetical protein